MPIVVCPVCDEDEELRGKRRDDGTVQLFCESCGATWDRNLTPVCGLCGSDDVEAVRTDTLQESGRGDQWAPSGIQVRYRCWSCGGMDVTGPDPQAAPPDWKEQRGQRPTRDDWRGI